MVALIATLNVHKRIVYHCVTCDMDMLGSVVHAHLECAHGIHTPAARATILYKAIGQQGVIKSKPWTQTQPTPNWRTKWPFMAWMWFWGSRSNMDAC